jgi:hypothetical protein
MNGKLEGAPNRARDKDLTVKQAGESYLIQPPEGLTEDEFIARMFQLDKNYKDDLKYEKFPSEKEAAVNLPFIIGLASVVATMSIGGGVLQERSRWLPAVLWVVVLLVGGGGVGTTRRPWTSMGRRPSSRART